MKLFNAQTEETSEEFTLNADMLDVQHMDNDAEALRIPLKLKINDIHATFLVAAAGEENYDCEEDWQCDFDNDKTKINMCIDTNFLLEPIHEGSIHDVTADFDIMPYPWTREEAKKEVAAAKEHDSFPINEYEIIHKGEEPYYEWQVRRDQIQNEMDFLKNRKNNEFHYGFCNVYCSQEELEKIKEMLLSIPEIKALVDGIKACIVPVGKGAAV